MPSQAPSRFATLVGQNIKAARLSCDLTQRLLAERVGVDAMLVSKWERGRHRPNDQNLALIAEQTNRDLAWFYAEHEEQPA